MQYCTIQHNIYAISKIQYSKMQYKQHRPMQYNPTRHNIISPISSDSASASRPLGLLWNLLYCIRPAVFKNYNVLSDFGRPYRWPDPTNGFSGGWCHQSLPTWLSLASTLTIIHSLTPSASSVRTCEWIGGWAWGQIRPGFALKVYVGIKVAFSGYIGGDQPQSHQVVYNDLNTDYSAFTQRL